MDRRNPGSQGLGDRGIPDMTHFTLKVKTFSTTFYFATPLFTSAIHLFEKKEMFILRDILFSFLDTIHHEKCLLESYFLQIAPV